MTGFPLELGTGAMGKKTRVLGLPDRRKSLKIGLAVYTQYRRVTDRQPASQPSFPSKYRASKRRAGKNCLAYKTVAAPCEAQKVIFHIFHFFSGVVIQDVAYQKLLNWLIFKPSFSKYKRGRFAGYPVLLSITVISNG